MKKILSAFVIGGLSVGNICFGDATSNPSDFVKFYQRSSSKIKINKETAKDIRVKSRVRHKIKPIKRIVAVQKYKRKVRNLIKNPNFRTAMGVSALIGGGIAAYCYIPDLLKLVSRYFESTSRLVNAGQKVAEKIGNSDVIKATDWTKVIDVAKKCGLYAAGIATVSVASAVIWSYKKLFAKNEEPIETNLRAELKESILNEPDRLKHALEEIEKIKKELEDKQSEERKAREDYDNAVKDKEAFEQQKKDLEQQKKDLEQQKNTLIAELKQLKELKEMKDEHKRIKSEYNQVKDKLKNAREEIIEKNTLVLSGGSEEEVKNQYNSKETVDIHSLTLEKDNETTNTVFLNLNNLYNWDSSLDGENLTENYPTAVEFLGANSDQSIDFIRELKRSSRAAYLKGHFYLYPSADKGQYYDEEDKVYDDCFSITEKSSNMSPLDDDVDDCGIVWPEDTIEESLKEKRILVPLDNTELFYGNNNEYVGIVRKIDDKLIVAFPGTRTDKNFFDDFLKDIQFVGNDGGYGVSAHSGFAKDVMKLLGNMIEKIKEQTKNGNINEIWFTGHSKGGGEAILAALKFATYLDSEVKDNEPLSVFCNENRIRVFTFSAPAVIDKKTKDCLYDCIGNHNIICAHRKSDMIPWSSNFASTVAKAFKITDKELVPAGIRTKLAKNENNDKKGVLNILGNNPVTPHKLKTNFNEPEYKEISQMLQYVKNHYKPLPITASREFMDNVEFQYTKEGFININFKQVTQ